MKVLQFRDESLNEIIEEAEKCLALLKKDSNSYSNLLYKLSLDVFYRLMENNVSLECVPEDLDLVRIASSKAAEAFKESTGISITLEVIGNLSEEK